MVEDLAIAEVAEKFQVTTRTIRYYEEIGLVHPHRENGHRRFSRKDITRLSLVFRGKKYGFQLEEIKNMIQLIDLDPSGVQQLEKTMEYGRRKMKEIDRRLLELEQLKAEMNSWLQKFEEELVKKERGTPVNLSELLAYQSRKYPLKEGLITPTSRLTYKEWNFKVNQFAHALRSLGIQPADKVMIHMPNTIEFVISYFAVHRVGAIAVPVNARLINSELSYIFDHSDTTFFLTHELLFEQVTDLVHEKKGTFIKTGSATDYWLSFEELMSNESGTEIVNTAEEDTEASILYTSGTTGKPKGVVFTHRNILTVSRMMAVEMEMKPSSRMLHMMPLSHSAPLHLFMAAGTYVGAAHILAPSFSPELLLELASSERTTHFFGAPVAYLLTAKHPKVTEIDLSWMKYWVYGGAPLSRSEVQFIQEQLDTEQLYCVYGLTEAGPNGSLLLPLEHDEKAGSIGQRAALNCEMKVVDDQGNEAGIDEVGEIILRGEGTMKGYYKDEVKTKEALKDGWLYTGDLAQRDQDGFYWVVDRKKDIIISGGSNVYPREIEDALLRHPHVQDVAVIGVPHPDWGETVKAFIVQDGTMNHLAEECKEYLRQEIADYKIPKLYEEISELPRNATGKLMKNQLRDQIHNR